MFIETTYVTLNAKKCGSHILKPFVSTPNKIIKETNGLVVWGG